MVVGARGQLGAAIVHEYGGAHDVVPLSRADLDVADDRAVDAAIDRIRPDAIVNGAAYNDVDGAEDDPVAALDVNACAVRTLARGAERHGAVLVHYSSDFVFDGAASAPYTEDDRPAPRSVYAASKLLGEWFALDAARAYVLRVESLFGRAPGASERGSVATIARTLRGGESPRAFEDRTVSPTYIPDAARATRRLLEMLPPPGVYHCVNSGRCTWFELAQELGRQLGATARVTAVTMDDVPLRAARPRYSALSNDKLRRAGIEMPSWQDAVARYAREAIAPPLAGRAVE
jgi:dTDP-4-dehydrorhamnose reductase